MAAEVLNSSSVLRLNFCTKLNICPSISATSPSREPLAEMKKQQHHKTFKIKNLITAIFGLFLIQSNLYSQTLKCEDFKTGKFELIDQPNNVKYIIERFNDFQTEEGVDLKTGNVVSEKGFFKLKWIDNCSFNLLIDTNKTAAKDFELKANEDGGVTTKIIEINGNCAIINCIIRNDILRYEICKIN